jgi:hypothetical protein
MAALVWDKVGERLYETGVSNGVLFVRDGTGAYPKGVAWNGLTNVTEKPTGAEANPFYADNIKYLNILSVEEFEASIEAFMYPDEFAQCDGSAELIPGVKIGQQNRKVFGLAYKTVLGNDALGDAYGYKLHLVYGANAAPSEKSYGTINDSPEPMGMSWDLTTTPVAVTGFKPTACLTIESPDVDPTKLAAFEKVLFGDTATESRLPLPDEVKTLLAIA